MCIFGKVSLSVLWWVLGVFWMCVFGKVSLNVLRRVLGEYSDYMFNIPRMIIV